MSIKPKETITYIIPLRSKGSTSNWNIVSKACTGTLGSIANQDSGHFRCILVCHEPPEVVPNVPNLTIINMTTPIPTDFEGYKQDKGLKVNEGVRRYLENPTPYFMVVDADDRIHHNLTTYIEGHTSFGNMLVDTGFVYGGGLWLRAHKGSFDKLCGTNFVQSHEEVEKEGIHVSLGHHTIKERFAKAGTSLHLVPFFAVIKMVGYGDNLTLTEFLWSQSFKRTVKKAMMMKLITNQIKKDFSLDHYPHPTR